MKVRNVRTEDLPALQAMAEASAFPYPEPDSPLIETALVAVNDNDEPIMALAAKRLVELYLYTNGNGHPAARLHALRLLDEAMQKQLRARGYSSAEAFLPPTIAKSFGRRLVKSLNFKENWTSWTKSF